MGKLTTIGRRWRKEREAGRGAQPSRFVLAFLVLVAAVLLARAVLLLREEEPRPRTAEERTALLRDGRCAVRIATGEVVGKVYGAAVRRRRGALRVEMLAYHRIESVQAVGMYVVPCAQVAARAAGVSSPAGAAAPPADASGGS